MFRVGQRVVCVDASPSRFGECSLQEGAIYTITALPLAPDGLCGVMVDRAVCKARFGFWPRRFRPVVERKTDISIFTKMLTPKTRRVQERA